MIHRPHAFVACLVAAIASAAAQEPARPRLAVLDHLRNKDVEQALAALAVAADQPAPEQLEHPELPSAAGGLYRVLINLDADERYDLLYAWTMPSEARRSVRLLTCLTPHDAPPSAFARALGERPRETSFAVSRVGPVRGLLNTGWLLATAAEEVGRLRRLIAELEPLAADNIPNAQTLLVLAHLADARADLTLPSKVLEARAVALDTAAANPGEQPPGIDPADLALAAAALTHEPLQEVSEHILGRLAEHSLGTPPPELRPFLRVAHAVAVQLHRGQSPPESLYENRLKHWVPVSGKKAGMSARGAGDAMWLVHEDHILHLAGAGSDVLLLRYPLVGDFEFTCETQEGGGRLSTDGGLVYGGLQYEALGSTGQLTVWDADIAHHVLKPCPFVWHEDRPIFNRLGIRSSGEGATLLVNLHPMWLDGPQSQQSPWLGLRSFSNRRPLFRNLELTGNPVIPREVKLSEGDSLRGWQAAFYGELQPSVFGEESETQAENPAWFMSQGVITARQRQVEDGWRQGRLHYQRPLLDGESIDYEFHYTSGVAAIHPALGRLAFVIEPDGVRVHWMTDGANEWTGLPEDNSLLEPLNRRGPRPLPLKENQWNGITLSRTDGKLALSLNGTLIYQRVIDFGGDHTFGFYRDRSQPAAQVRNVVLRGDWPDKLPENLLESAEIGGRNRRAANQVTGDAFLAENVQAVRRRASSMPPAERFVYLRDWILPEPVGKAPGTFRMAGEFTPTQPPPTSNPAVIDEGAKLVSPVYDLLAVAKELGKLEELRSQVETLPEPTDEHARRARLALSILLSLEVGDREAASKAMDQFYPLVAAKPPADLDAVWPQTLLIHYGADGGPGHSLMVDLLGLMFQQHTMKTIPVGIEFWHTHVASLMGRHQYSLTGSDSASFDSPAALQDWIPVDRLRARSRGKGYALTRWHRNREGELHHRSGHQEEYLFYRSPLRGNFDLTCEIGASGTTQVLAAGMFCGPVSDVKLLERGTFRRGAISRDPIDPPLSKFDPWVHYRAAFRDGVCTVYINGRPVHSQELGEHYDPWLAIRSWWRNGGHVRDVRIVGNPVVPDEVLLSGSPELDGWLPYHEESIGYATARWQHSADPESSGWIVGRRGADLAGTYSESLLLYQRPLIEDGSIEYEFFYEPGKLEAHPALDRLAFLLHPQGVRLHWITDSPYDRTGIGPDNVFEEPHNRRGPATLPLEPSAWNHLRLSIAGNVVSLALNGQLIYERSLEANNLRRFGIFHYVSNTEARVRNVIMRSNWPRTVPSASEQELANPVVAALDADLSRLKSVFTHEFGQLGLNGEFFKYKDSRGGSRLAMRPDGLQVVRPAAGSWISAEIAAQFVARGDFDLVAEYDELDMAGDNDASIMLVARLADDRLHHCRSIRNRIAGNRQVFQVSLAAVDKDGKRSFGTKQFTCEARRGKLRLARRGNEVYHLLADGDSFSYRLFGKETVTTADTLPGGIDLSVVATGTATTTVVWKSLRIAAEELLLVPDAAIKPKNVLYVMNADGTGLQQITQSNGEQSHGSPDWSPDGKQIAFDVWGTSGSSGAHIWLVNADGTGLKDLGIGMMPTFSPDGNKLAFTWSGQGMAIMNLDGTNRQVIAGEGWGAQWSPDGRWIAYESRQAIDGRVHANITIIDVATRQKRVLLENDKATRYSQVYWNMEWSPDSRQICFKGSLSVPVSGVSSELAVTDVAGSSQGFKVLTTANVQTDFSWRPDGRSILLSMNAPQHGGNRLFSCDPQSGALSLLATQPLDQNNVSGVWSPDGRRIVFTSHREPQPIPWRPGSSE